MNLSLNRTNKDMKRISSYIILFAAALCLAPVASAQDLDPRVEVTRAYVAKSVDVSKPAIEMAVPDSVLKFDLDFEYTVTDSPYKGSYEFKPYAVDLKPQSSPDGTNWFFLRAGAGYAVHPVFDIVVSPDFKTPAFSGNVYGSHRSYIGQYRSITALADGRLDWDRNAGERYSAYNTATKAGMNGRAEAKKFYFIFDAAYEGYAHKEQALKRAYDAVDAKLKLTSRNSGEKYFFYDIELNYLYSEDKLDMEGMKFIGGHEASVKLSLGPVFSRQTRFVVDALAEYSVLGSYLNGHAAKFDLNPKYMIRKNRWTVNAGVVLSVPLNDELSGLEKPKLKGQVIYPDVHIGFDILKNYLNVYLSATGGTRLNTYSSLVRRDNFVNASYNLPAQGLGMMKTGVERVNACVGLKGNIGSRLMYNLYGGYAYHSNLLLDALYVPHFNEGETPASYNSALAYADGSLWYASLDLGWHSRDVEIEASLRYRTFLFDRQSLPAFEPSPLTGRLDAIYNWNRRIYVGLHADGALGRSAAAALGIKETPDLIRVETLRIPGYLDLGVSAEYRFTRKFSLWLYGGNLLNMTIQRSPLRSENGISATAGITLTL